MIGLLCVVYDWMMLFKLTISAGGMNNVFSKISTGRKTIGATDSNSR